MNRQELQQKYSYYKDQGHFILGITLSTYIESDRFAQSDVTRNFWEHHFMRRVMRRLPPVPRLDHDYVMEKSPEGFWHYHGLLAVSADYEKRLWKEGALHPRLRKDVASFRKMGRYRNFRVNSFLIEPLQSLDAWCAYITKQQH